MRLSLKTICLLHKAKTREGSSNFKSGTKKHKKSVCASFAYMIKFGYMSKGELKLLARVSAALRVDGKSREGKSGDHKLAEY